MMERRVLTHIEESLCNGCGACVEVCPSDTLAMVEGKARVVGETSLQCGHCAAVCPTGAVTVDGMDPKMQEFYSAPPEAVEEARPPSFASLAKLMLYRRSCRVYHRRPVDRATLSDLVKIGASAPSGTNCQMWTFRVIPDRSSVVELGSAVARFYSQLNFLSALPPARWFSKLVMNDELGLYYREYRDRIKKGIEEFRTSGRDLLFHGAPAAIMIGSRPPASTPGEDALLAAQNILLAAETLGLGTCLIGLVVEAIKNDFRIRKTLGLARGERIHAVVAVGHPKLRYARPAGRRAQRMEWWQKSFDGGVGG
jgi:nitroreductase/NAD-dependent dihydropyrimidine dehydrogenase PreA subunit